MAGLGAVQGLFFEEELLPPTNRFGSSLAHLDELIKDTLFLPKPMSPSPEPGLPHPALGLCPALSWWDHLVIRTCSLQGQAHLPYTSEWQIGNRTSTSICQAWWY